MDSVEFPCSYLNSTRIIVTVLDAVLLRTQAPAIEIASIFVDKCPDICSTIYGNGNPDISGIGVFISFLIQSVYWALFRPFLAMLFLCIPKDVESKTVKASLGRLKRLSEAIHGTSIFLNFTTLVAGVVRMKQSPPEYEAIYLHRLSSYIGVMSRGSFIVSSAFAQGPIDSDRDRWYDLLDFGISCLADYLDFVTTKYRSSLVMIRAVAGVCSGVRLYPAPPSSITPTYVSWSLFSILGGVIGCVGGCIGSWKFGGWFYRLIRGEGVRLIRVAWQSRLVWAVFFGSYNISLIISVILNTMLLSRDRSMMKAANSSSYLDNEWGFGQVTAIMIWIPITLWILRRLIRVVFQAIPWFSVVGWFVKLVYQRYGGEDDGLPSSPTIAFICKSVRNKS